MTRTFALLLVAAVAACTSSDKKAESSKEWSPKFERTKQIYEIKDEKTGKRVGFVEKATYDDGKVVYWVTGLDRGMKLGYMTANNNGYKYEWIAGKRSETPEFLGADTFQANARRILGYDSPVTLNEISWEALLKELDASQGGK